MEVQPRLGARKLTGDLVPHLQHAIAERPGAHMHGATAEAAIAIMSASHGHGPLSPDLEPERARTTCYAEPAPDLTRVFAVDHDRVVGSRSTLPQPLGARAILGSS